MRAESSPNRNRQTQCYLGGIAIECASKLSQQISEIIETIEARHSLEFTPDFAGLKAQFDANVPSLS
jgi:hypothetical protein